MTHCGSGLHSGAVAVAYGSGGFTRHASEYHTSPGWSFTMSDSFSGVALAWDGISLGKCT
jgi:hypothetical protein